MAEAYALSNAVERGLRARAIVVDMRRRLNIPQRGRSRKGIAFASNRGQVVRSYNLCDHDSSHVSVSR